MKPQVPAGLRVEYKYDKAHMTPGGRWLALPHRRTTAYLLQDHPEQGVESGLTISCVMAWGEAVAKEGPLADGSDLNCNGQCKMDQFSRQIGRDIALGRAIKAYNEFLEDVEAEEAAS